MVELAGARKSSQCTVREDSGEENWGVGGTERRQNQTHPGEVKMTVKVIIVKLRNRYVGIASPSHLFEVVHGHKCKGTSLGRDALILIGEKELRTMKETHLTVERKGKEESCTGREPGTQRGILDRQDEE